MTRRAVSLGPGHVVETPSGWNVVDALAYCYGDDRARGASDHRMTSDKARGIAVNIAKLPELLGSRKSAEDSQ